MSLFKKVNFKNISQYIYNPDNLNFIEYNVFEPMTSIIAVAVNVAKVVNVRFAEHVLTHLLNRFARIEDNTFKQITKIVDSLMNYPEAPTDILNTIVNKSIVIGNFSKLTLITVMDLSNKIYKIASSADTDEVKIEQIRIIITEDICDPSLLDPSMLQTADVQDYHTRFIYPKKTDTPATVDALATNDAYCVTSIPWIKACTDEYAKIALSESENKFIDEMDWFDRWSPKFMETFGLPIESTNTTIMLEVLEFDFDKLKQKSKHISSVEIIEDHFGNGGNYSEDSLETNCKSYVSEDHEDQDHEEGSDNDLYEIVTPKPEDYIQLVTEYSDITNDLQKIRWITRWKHILDDFADDPEDALSKIITLLD